MKIPEIAFEAFPKISRYSREVIVTEKIDGTNACVYINDTGTEVFAGSRTRWITPEDDNYGFAKWVEANREELLKLGPGFHFGEWWGAGIQRRYGLKEKRFSLFNIHRWGKERPACCHVVPELWRGPMDDLDIDLELYKLRENGSTAAPGFMQPEGIVIYHTASGALFKKTLDKDDQPKGQAA